MSEQIDKLQSAKNELSETRMTIAGIDAELDPLARQLRAVAVSDFNRARLEPQVSSLRGSLAAAKLEESRLVNEIIQLTRDAAGREHVIADAAWRDEVAEQRRFADELRAAAELALQPVKERVATAESRAKSAKIAMQAANELTASMF